MKEFKIQQRTIIGVSVMLVGAILLMSSMGIIGSDVSIGMFWPVVLIVLGVIRIVNFDESTYVGIIFLILGGYFQLRKFNIDFLENVNLVKIFWPGIVILFGVSLILPDKFKTKKYNIKKDYRLNEDSVDVNFEEDL